MFHVLINTILPIFSIILLGYVLKLRNTIEPAYARTANQIVFNVAIPALLLSEIGQASFKANFNLSAVLSCLGALGIVVILGLVFVHVLKIPRNRRGTFLQSSFHGNIGYMSYAIAYYTLGESHFARMAILSSFIMLSQNLLAVWALTSFGSESHLEERGRWLLLKTIAKNPIIITVCLGITYSAMGLSLPHPVKKGLDILSGMAFPTALLLIGASLSFGSFRLMVREILGIGTLKLLCLPILGYSLMVMSGVPDTLLLSGVILLAAPPATITYVMAMELGGDPELAATSVSIYTLVSALTYSLILSSFVV
jgi:malate permease and related proteins